MKTKKAKKTKKTNTEHIRKMWGFSPVTRVKKSKKVYKREKANQDD